MPYTLLPAGPLADVRAAVARTMGASVTLVAPGAETYDEHRQRVPGAPVEHGPIDARWQPESSADRIANGREAGETVGTMRIKLADLLGAGAAGPPTTAWSLVWHRAAGEGGEVRAAIRGVVPVRGYWVDLECSHRA